VRLLILGGTLFVGRHLVAAALQRGHTVTLFNRGQHNPDLFPEVEKLRGDRAGDLAALRGRRWDAAVDTNGYIPRLVAASARALEAAVEHFTFISTLSVYALPGPAGLDETAAVAALPPALAGTEVITAETYGPLKALCEQAVLAVFGGRALVLRPGLIVGPHDPTDRFTYWPVRVARGGEVLAPGRPERPVQFIDARDLAAWTLDLIEQRHAGTFNAVGPAEPLTMGALLAACRAEASQAARGAAARFAWVPDQFLQAHNVQPYTELPLWVPEAEAGGFDHFSARRALEAGLKIRPLSVTIRDTLAWAASRPAAYAWRNGLAPEREAALLEAWRQTRNQPP
jgi:2'-hydroxyisoflavone reductase